MLWFGCVIMFHTPPTINTWGKSSGVISSRGCRDLTHLQFSQLSPKLPFCLFVLSSQYWWLLTGPFLLLAALLRCMRPCSVACYGGCYFTVLLTPLGLSALKPRSRTERQKLSLATLTHCREWHARLGHLAATGWWRVFKLHKLSVCQSF